jgi:hypothetical protein
LPPPSDRWKALFALIEWNAPLSDIVARLREHPAEPSKKLIELTPWDIGYVLERFIEAEMTARDVKDWALLIESCGDIDFGSDEVTAAIHWLANPAPAYPLNIDSAFEFLKPLPSYRCKVSLGVSHPWMDPAEITAAIGLSPRFAHRVGDPRKSPKGRPLGGIWNITNWSAMLVEEESHRQSLADALIGALARLSSHGDFFHRIRAEGGRVRLHVGWFFHRGNTGEEFDSAFLGRMAELGINLSLDIYSPKRALSPIVPV